MSDRNNDARRRNLAKGRYALHGAPLEPAPFVRWLRTLGNGPTEIAARVGVPERAVRRYLNDGWCPHEATVDRWLTRVDDGTRIDDLYELGEADGQCAVGHPQGDSSSLAPRRSPTARSIQRSEQEAA